jgi:hypothetical protein
MCGGGLEPDLQTKARTLLGGWAPALNPQPSAAVARSPAGRRGADEAAWTRDRSSAAPAVATAASAPGRRVLEVHRRGHAGVPPGTARAAAS